MKNVIRILSLLLVLTMVFVSSTLAETVTEAEKLADLVANLVLPTPVLPLVQEPITLKMNFPRLPAHGSFEDNFFLKAVAKLTNITLEVEPIESSGWDEKVSLLFASGDYGDIFLSGISFSQAAIFGQAGKLLPLDDLLEKYAPNAMTILNTLPETRRNVTAVDGHIYMMAAYDGTPRDMLMNGTYAQTLNKEWLTKLGLEVPETLGEFYDMLVAFRDKDPNGNGTADEIPYSFVYNNKSYNMPLGAFGFVNLKHDIINGKYAYVPMEENYRHYLEFMNKLYAEGLLDNDVFIQTTENYQAKTQGMTIGFMPDVSGEVLGQENYLKCVNMKPLSSQYNETPVHPGRSQEVDKYGLVITDKCSEEKQIAAVKLLDFFYSEEGSYLIKCGPEYGVWGDMIDGGYQRTIAADGSVSYKLVYDTEKYNKSYFNFRMANGLMQMPFFYTGAHAKVIIGGNVVNNWLTQLVMESGMLYARRVGYPQWVTFSEDEQDILAPYVLLDGYVDQMTAKFITGEVEINDGTWAEYLRTINAMDVETLINTRQEAYDRWNK